MKKPNQDSSILENFPTDIWAYLAIHLTGEQLGRLKMTGAKLLWLKLTHPRVVKSVHIGTDFLILKSWPAFLKEFPSIENLTIHIKSQRWWSELDLRLASMPPTLKKLKFRGWGSVGKFFSGKKISLKKLVPQLEVLDLGHITTPNHRWLLTAGCLTKLKSWKWTFRSSLLPRGLQVVEVNYLLFDDTKDALPPALCKLDIFEGEISDRNVFAFLPRSMTSVTLPRLGFSIAKSPDIVSQLPRTLTELSIQAHLPSSAWKYLPPSLQKLSFYADEPPQYPEKRGLVTYDPCPLETLPRSITHLETSAHKPTLWYPPSDISLPTYFPPRLTTLNIAMNHLSPEGAKLLPSSILSLHLANLCEQICKHLPKGLTSLKARSVLVGPNLIKLLPKSLTRLRMTYPLQDDLWIDYNTGINLKRVSKRPEYPAHQEYCRSENWGSDIFPPNLIRLVFHWHCYGVGDSFLEKQKLPNLLELKLDKTCHITNRYIPHLNPHLVSLVIGSPSITGECFRHLPRSLTHLKLETSSIQDSDIQHLPRGLKTLYMDDANDLTSCCVADFPDLVYLSLYENFEIEQSSLPNFPYTLRSRQLGITVRLATWYIDDGEVVEEERDEGGEDPNVW